MQQHTHPAPPFDHELVPVLKALEGVVPASFTPEMIEPMRAGLPVPKIDDLLAGRDIMHEERSIPVDGGEIMISIFKKPDHTGTGLGIVYLHGGGMILGDRFTGADEYLDWVDEFDAVAVSIDYRLAPEFPDPTPVNDSYAGVVWAFGHAEEIGIDPQLLVVAGVSAGGGLAAGVTLKARDDGSPKLAASLLICPMLDDRNDTVSSHQIDGIGVWDRGSNDTGWDAYLGDRRKTDAVSIYAAPSRATDLTGLPPTFIDCATVEVFRDEDVAYATKIWEQGGIAELHVWPGGFHNSDGMTPTAALSILARTARVSWLHRTLKI